MAIANRYAGRCGCSRWVPEGAGKVEKTNGKWVLQCARCFGIAQEAARADREEEPDDSRCPGCEYCDGEGGPLSWCREQEEKNRYSNRGW